MIRQPLMLLVLLLCLSACNRSSSGGAAPGAAPNAPAAPSAPGTPTVVATPRAVCGPGSRPETGIQGRVSAEDHASGRAAEGYSCNTELIGSYTIPNAMGTVAGFKVERYVDAAGHECAYYDTTMLFPTNAFDMEAGVNVLDMSDPANPVRTARLLTPAMLSPHESLVLNQKRGVLAAALGNPATLPGIVDLYDVSQDCRSPVLMSSLPVGILGHESGISPDGNTFYVGSAGGMTLVAIDISNLTLPRTLSAINLASHGLNISDDGNRAYVAAVSPVNGLVIVDTSQVQARAMLPQMREISRLTWTPGSIPQNAIPITVKGKPYLVEIDEYGAQQEVGAGRIIDISDETAPKIISNLRLEVHQPENFAAQAGDPSASGDNPVHGYAGHYCNVPTRVDPPIVACSMILSGLRIFDIRDPHNPREVAYFNAPANPLIAPTFEGGNFAQSSPAFVPERKEIWYGDGSSGFYVIRVTNGMWP